MSDEEGFSSDENVFIHQVENFYTAFSLAKLCAQKCNIIRAEKSNTLTNKETDCLSK